MIETYSSSDPIAERAWLLKRILSASAMVINTYNIFQRIVNSSGFKIFKKPPVS
jgi:hypothetical protein